MEGHADVCALLLKRGATVNWQGSVRLAPHFGLLIILCRFSRRRFTMPHLVVVIVLLLCCSTTALTSTARCLLTTPSRSPIAQSSGANWTPLMLAAGHGKWSTCRLLVERGARLDFVDKVWR